MSDARYHDLLKQGFMRPRRGPRKLRVKGPTVACDMCQDWHEKGRHVKVCPYCKRRHHHPDQCSKRPT